MIEYLQDLLLNYPRAKSTFVVAYQSIDEVTSASMMREGNTPEDYLSSFALFVRTNKTSIEAIKILLERPKSWKTSVLEDLRTKLKQNHYDEKQLQKAHKQVYHKALVDIISMVKHAVIDGEVILTAEERVDRAIAKVTSGKSFNSEQQTWLGYIREHLVKHLTIEAEDLNIIPIFTNHGGLGKAKKIFGKDLGNLIEELNSAIAA
jgi:type I restriction enzyme R subunit